MRFLTVSQDATYGSGYRYNGAASRSLVRSQVADRPTVASGRILRGPAGCIRRPVSIAISNGRRATARIRVRFGETDAAGIVYYGAYFAWFDIGSQELMRLPGVPSIDPDGRPHYPIPMVDCGATFLAPVRYDQELDVVSSVVEIGTTSIRIAHEIRALDGRIVARGFQQRVLVRFTAGGFQKVSLPQALRDHLSGASARSEGLELGS
jgi:YbgC/YbaW family acyl-CoA thioester hydrolase